MTDEAFLKALERCELAESAFGHADHVRAAYLYLKAGDFSNALDRTRRAIRNHAKHLGKADRYHETITVAYLALIQQHIVQRGDSGGWMTFARDNPELLRRDLLREFYSEAQLESELARRVFVLPHPNSAQSLNKAV
jgi:hypothetical protein